MANISQITLPDGNTYDIKDANATDTKVTQTQDDSTNNNFEILLAGSTSTSTATEEAKKSTYLKFNPSKRSFSVGGGSSASGNNSHAEGSGTTASGNNSHAEGSGTTASGNTSHAEGGGSTASGDTSHAEGGSTHAYGDYSHTEGFNTTTSLSGSYAHAEGNGTTASGAYAHVEGGGSTASGSTSHAEGASTTASGASAHSEGAGTTASGNYSHAEGYNGTQAVAPSAHAEGTHTTAAGDAAHSEGADTTATGNYAHAEGLSTVANGYNSHSQGQNTTATHRSQFVFGEYNELDTSTAQASSKGTYVELVGNGTSNSARSNARTLDWSGNEWLAGTLTVGANPTNNMDVATKQYVDGLVSSSVTDVEVNGSSVVTSGVAEITLGTASALDVASSGDASSSQVVKGDDSRLVDTTYTFAEGSIDGAFSVTPSGDSAQSVPIHNVQTSLLGGNIPSGVDLNDYRTAKHYWINNTSISNLPVAEYGMLEVIPKDTGTTTAIIQRYTSVSNNSVTGVYERVYVSGAWRAWKQVGEDTFLPLEGGTLTGDLTIAKVTPAYYAKKTELTIDTSSNNGASTDVSSYIIHADSTNSYFGRFRSTAYSDGRVASLIDARNMKSDGNRVANYLAVGVNKDGSRYFAFPNDSAGDARDVFREAIKIGTNNISKFSGVNVPNGTHTQVNMISPPKGTYLIIAGVSFENNATGVRRILLSRSSSSSSNPVLVDSDKSLHELTVPAASLSSSYTQSISVTTIATISDTHPEVYLRAYQNSGSAMTVSSAIQYIRIA